MVISRTRRRPQLPAGFPAKTSDTGRQPDGIYVIAVPPDNDLLEDIKTL